MTDKTREDFEAWAKSKGAPKHGWWLRQIDDGGYSCGPVDDAWNGYQAATQRQQKRIAELEAEVQALRRDAERLDWIAINGTFGVDSSTGLTGGNGLKRKAATRKAIDAAIEAERTKP